MSEDVGSPEARVGAAIAELVATGETLTAAAVRRRAGVGQETAVRLLAKYRASVRVEASSLPAGMRALFETVWKQALSQTGRLHEEGAVAAEGEVAEARQALEVSHIKVGDLEKQVHRLQEELGSVRQVHQVELDGLRQRCEEQAAAASAEVEAAHRQVETASERCRELQTQNAVLEGKIEVLQAQARDLWGETSKKDPGE